MKQRAAKPKMPMSSGQSKSLGAWLKRQGSATRRAMTLPWVRDVLALFAASRIAFICITYVGYVLIHAPKYGESSVGVAGLLTAWDQWDAQRYVAIATAGYTNATLTAFFPLYPLIVGILSAPFGGQAAYVVGLIVSNVAMLGALLVLHALVRERWSEQVAWRTVLYMTVFPTALFTFAPYNESLFLLLVLGSFLALSRRRWALAGALGGLAALTRAPGILLLIPFAYVWWQARETRTGGAATPQGADGRGAAGRRYALAGAGGTVGRRAGTGIWRAVQVVLPGAEAVGTGVAGAGAAQRAASGQTARRQVRPGWGALGWALLVPLGLALYGAYCAARFGDALAFSHAQATWNRVLAWPWVAVEWQLQGLRQAAPASFFQAHDLLDLAATAGFAALLVAGWRRLPAEQSLYVAALLLLFVVEPGGVHLHTHDPMSSNSRYVLEMFPGFIMLAVLTAERPRVHQAVVLLFTTLLATLTLVFILGRWLV